MITERTKKLIDKFMAEYKEAVNNVYGGDKEMALAEDVTTYYTLDVQIMKTKIKFTTTYTGISGNTYVESESDEDEVKELLKKWRTDMRRARRYWGESSDVLDRMADSEEEEPEEE